MIKDEIRNRRGSVDGAMEIVRSVRWIRAARRSSPGNWPALPRLRSITVYRRTSDTLNV